MSFWRPTSLSAAAPAAALLGSGATILIVVTVNLVSAGDPAGDILGAVLFLSYAFIVMVAAASVLLAALGIPLALAMRQNASRTWLVPVSIGIGGSAGLLVAVLLGDSGMPKELVLWTVMFGAVTGLFWLLLARPVLNRQQAEDHDASS